MVFVVRLTGFRDNFAPMCVIEVDVKTIPFTRKTKPNGEAYKAIYVDTILLFGGTEFTAQIAWKENVSRLPVHV